MKVAELISIEFLAVYAHLEGEQPGEPLEGEQMELEVEDWPMEMRPEDRGEVSVDNYYEFHFFVSVLVQSNLYIYIYI